MLSYSHQKQLHELEENFDLSSFTIQIYFSSLSWAIAEVSKAGSFWCFDHVWLSPPKPVVWTIRKLWLLFAWKQ